MKCKESDCKNCVHQVDLKTHPLFKDFLMKDSLNRVIEFQGCIFHLEVLFLRQLWIAQIGVQAAVESRGNQEVLGLAAVAHNLKKVTEHDFSTKKFETSLVGERSKIGGS